MRAGLLALLVLGGWNTAMLYANRNPAPYSVLPPRYQDFIDWIGENAPESTRVIFAGRTVHYYGGGHIAYLPILTGREMMADDYYAFPVGTIEYNYPPPRFRKSAGRLMDFMNLYNVSYVITYKDLWKKVFRQQPGQYEEQKDFEDLGIALFRVLREPAIFAKGNGTVQAGFNRIRVQLEDANAEAVIRYNWHDRLSVDAPAELFPWDAGDDIRFIGIRPNGKTDVEIKYKDWL